MNERMLSRANAQPPLPLMRSMILCYTHCRLAACIVSLLIGATTSLAGPRPWRADQVQRRSVVRPPVVGDKAAIRDAIPLIMAGDPFALPIDTPDLRIDPNTSDSPYRGVCSLLIEASAVAARCSAVPISPTHILTAGHCIDQNDDGVPDDDLVITITFNVDGDASVIIEPSEIRRVDAHPDFTGFDGDVNDDIAIISLFDPLPKEIPIYPPFRGELRGGELITMIGYGQSGFGSVGVSINSASTIKRRGSNEAEMFFEDDEGEDLLEVWTADFDPPLTGDGCFGTESLGNDVETSAAPGDSGGPSFAHVDDTLHVWGVNTFGSFCAGLFPTFGSESGGMVVNAYLPWIDTIVECDGNCNDCNRNGIPDGIDLLQSPEFDRDGNGLIDSCQFVSPGDLWINRTTELLGYGFSAEQIVINAAPGLFGMSSVRFGHDGSMYVAGDDFGKNGRAVYQLDPATGAILDILIPEIEGLGPGDLAFGPDGLVYVLHPNGIIEPSFVTRHDPMTGALIDTFIFDDPDTPEDEAGGLQIARFMAFGPDGNLFVTDDFQEGVARFDGTTGEFLGYFAPDGPVFSGFGESGICFHGDSLYVGRFNRVYRFDASTGDFIDVVIEAWPVVGILRDFAFGPDGLLHVLTTAGFGGVVYQYDPETGELLNTLVSGSDFSQPNSIEFRPFVDDDPSPDLDGDGDVDFTDLLALLNAWGDCDADCPEDLDDSRSVGFADLLILLANWS